MHAIEKILAEHAGVPCVRAGQIVNCDIDMAEVNDLYLQVIRSFREVGAVRVRNPERTIFVLDHYAPAPTIQSASNQREMRDFVREQGISHLFDVNAGVCHQVMPEAGLVWPGMILVATDSHTTTDGAFGAFGTGVGATDLATILATGELWFRVPEILRITLNGRLPEGVEAKDVILHIIGTLKQDAAVYKAIEFDGPAVEGFGIADRMTICNMAVELGAKTAYMRPNRAVLDYVRSRTDRTFEVHQTDPEYRYDSEHAFDVSALEPQVAAPHSVDNVVPVRLVAGRRVDQVFIGTCTNGRIEDIAAAARILSGKSVHPGCRLVVIPASRQVMLEAVRLGYAETLLEAGATFSTPGCGPCLGAHQGVLAPGEVCVTTGSRNFPGRMGSNKAEIYSASASVAAATALRGELCDPREFAEQGVG